MPPIPGPLTGAGEEDETDADADAAGEAGGRRPGDEPGVVAAAAGAIGGTAIAVVFADGGGVAVADTVGATPAGILIVGMPMIVADRGGIELAAAAAAAAAGVVAAGVAGFAAAAGAAAAGAAAAAWPGFATPEEALPTISVTFSSMVCVSHGLGRFASAPTCVPFAAS